MFETEKKKYLSMSPSEKRNFFKKDPVTLAQIPTWVDYSDSNLQTAINCEELANKISLWEGDITTLQIDAIVNAANSYLKAGGGVDGAIHRAAGKYLQEECNSLGGCDVGEAKLAGGYMLPAKYIILTVGPQGEKPEELKKCYLNSLKLAKENNIRSVAFPCISTGVYGYPQKPAAEIAISTVKRFLEENKDSFDRVIFCVFLKTDKEIYEECLGKYLKKYF